MTQTDIAPSAAGGGLQGLEALAQDLTREPTRTRAWTASETWAACLGVAALGITAALAWHVSGAVVPWDSKNHFYPMFRFLADGLAKGEVPLWNPYHFGGHPSVADPQSLIFTPTMFLFAWLAPGASMQTFDGVIFSHLILGALAIVGLVRRRGWHPAGAVLAGLIFMLGGPASSRLQHTGMIISYAWIPVAFLMLEVALGRARLIWSLLFGLAMALVALGRDQVAFLGCLMLLGRLAGPVLVAPDRLAVLRRSLAVMLPAGATTLAILIVPSLLTMQFLDDSNRPGIAFGVAAAGSLNPVNLVTLFAPNVFGSLNWTYDYWGPGYETMVEPDWTDRAINYLFIGTLPALLLFWHGIAGGRLFGRAARPFLLIAILAALYAVGRATPVFALVFDHLPGVKLYRRPADATFIFVFALAMLSAYLLHRWIAEGAPNPFRALPGRIGGAFVLLGLGCAAILIGHAISFPSVAQNIGASLRELGFAAILAGGLAATMLAGGAGSGRRAMLAVVLVAATGGELIWRNAASSLNAEPAGRYVFDQMPAAQAAGLEALRQDLHERAVSTGAMPRVEILGLPGAWQNASMVFQLQNTLGYNPLRISEYARAVGPGENAVDPNARHFPGTFRGYRCNLASLLGLEYLVLDRPLTRLPRHVPRPTATPIFTGEGMYVYRLGRVAPRAYLATAVQAVDTEDVLEQHSLPAFDRSHVALIDSSDLDHLQGSYSDASGAPTPAAVRITSYENNRVALEVDARAPSVLVLHDLYYPGWEATVDGVTKRVMRANVLFRGVEVPAGHHVVAFAFHPFSKANLLAAVQGLLPASDE